MEGVVNMKLSSFLVMKEVQTWPIWLFPLATGNGSALTLTTPSSAHSSSMNGAYLFALGGPMFFLWNTLTNTYASCCIQTKT